jgi:putative Mn2+ efflux pump MntP
MNIVELLFLAIGLSMDAFAISLSLGRSVEKVEIRHILLGGLNFGGFHAIMPFAGHHVGKALGSRLEGVEHWTSFGLMAIIGLYLIFKSFGNGESHIDERAFRLASLAPIALGASVDSLGAGIGLALADAPAFESAAIIGALAVFFSIAGLKIGNGTQKSNPRNALILGGTMITFIGIKTITAFYFSR